jgi:hypothetical protein
MKILLTIVGLIGLAGLLRLAHGLRDMLRLLDENPLTRERPVRKQLMSDKLPAYRITFDDGDTIETSMAADVTLEDAKAYYLGNQFNLGDGPKDRMATAVKVEQLWPPVAPEETPAP